MSRSIVENENGEEFEMLGVRNDTKETGDEEIARFINGLRPKIQDLVSLRAFYNQ